MTSGWEDVRVAGILLRAHDRRAIGDQALVPKRRHHLVLDVELGDRPLRAARAARTTAGRVLIRRGRRCGPVRSEGGLSQTASKRGSGRRTKPPRPRASAQFDGAGNRLRKVRDGAVLRVLHGQPAPTGQQPFRPALSSSRRRRDRRAGHAVQVVRSMAWTSRWESPRVGPGSTTAGGHMAGSRQAVSGTPPG